MQTRYRLISIAGIPLYAHGTLLWSLGLLGVFLFLSIPDLSEASQTMIAAVLTLTCVVIHEYGHAMAARLLGVRVADVVLHVFFGMTRMEPPKSPRDEIMIGLAGPLANLLVALPLYPFAMGPNSWDGPLPLDPLATLFAINLVLGTVNLLPAFPMDGGRILRATLSVPLGPFRATRVAVAIGRGIAISAIIAPLLIGFERWMLLLPVLGFVLLYLGEAESRRATLIEEDRRVRRYLGDADPGDEPAPGSVPGEAAVVESDPAPKSASEPASDAGPGSQERPPQPDAPSAN